MMIDFPKRLTSAFCALFLLLSCLRPPACAAQADAGDKAREIAAGMPLRDKITQLLFVDFRKWMTLDGEQTISRIAEDPAYTGEPVTQINAEIAQMLAEYRFGGVILFSENLKSTEDSVHLVREMQRASLRKGGLPPFLGADQEGGNVTRLGQGTCLPGNMAIGATGKTEYAYEAGAVTGRELRAVGLNINFSPVSDVNDNPENPIINLRSFGSDPDMVSKMAVSMSRGIQSAGVVAVGKHFPGHGNTSSDSHTSLPLVEKDLDELRETELLPFQALIDADIGMLMCAHIQFPALDKTTFRSVSDGQEIVVPATFSSVILKDLLRGRMGYDGVIITDAMDMDAIAKHIAPPDAVVRALAAGADMICMPAKLRSPSDAAKIEDILLAVTDALRQGVLTQAGIDQSVERVVRLKIEFGLLDSVYDARNDQAAVQSALKTVGAPAHRAVEREIAQAAITLVRDEHSVIPFQPGGGEKVLVMTPYTNEMASTLYAINQLKADGGIPEDVVLQTYCYRGLNSVQDDLGTALMQADYIILYTEMSGTASLQAGHWLTDFPKAVWQKIQAAGKQDRFVLASIGAPFDIVNYADCPAVLLSYGCVGMSDADAETGIITGKYGPNIPALLCAVFGSFSPTGTIPVNMQ